jgi:spore germination cell wall hydrolase CwlJ-like protein
MHKRLYSLAAILLVSLTICFSTAFSNDKIIEVSYSQLTPDAKRQVDCLADNIYHEAGHEPEDGKRAVAFVTLNRTQDPRFPKDICGVVKQKTHETCQFTWYCEGKNVIRSNIVYNQAREVALLMYANYEKMKDITQGALYYHADYVHPKWKLDKTTQIGRHIFYKERDGI